MEAMNISKSRLARPADRGEEQAHECGWGVALATAGHTPRASYGCCTFLILVPGRLRSTGRPPCTVAAGSSGNRTRPDRILERAKNDRRRAESRADVRGTRPFFAVRWTACRTRAPPSGCPQPRGLVGCARAPPAEAHRKRWRSGGIATHGEQRQLTLADGAAASASSRGTEGKISLSGISMRVTPD